ncbi:unnamed protein product [Boreogadus saida]
MGKDCHHVYKHNLALTEEEQKDAGAILDKMGSVPGESINLAYGQRPGRRSISRASNSPAQTQRSTGYLVE